MPSSNANTETKTPAAGKAKRHETPALRIAAKTDGFRRAGVTHTSKAVDHAAGTFSPDEVKLLQAEEQLVVVELPSA